MNVSTDVLVRLQAKQDHIRNMCIMAHVDHGKTTLSDHLIGSNGLIHPKLMGELRYLDSREDEQVRGITMKSSSISLLYVPGASNRPQGPKSVPDEEKLSSGYLINLIDSPGHVDFCSEVSTAARLSDGALVVVDAVEGVCIQTHAVLRQAWEEKVTPCLFINKIDRLILELRLTPAEAYQRFQSIVTHVNMIMSAFHSEKYMSEADAVLAVEADREAAAAAAAERQSAGQDEAEDAQQQGVADDEQDVFQPIQCNVAFGSAYDGWAFRLDQFADMYAEKMGCKPAALMRALWGDYAFSAKDKRVVKIKGNDTKLKPMFVQFMLEPIWKAYSVLDGEDVHTVLGAIVKGRGLGALLPPKALDHPEARQALRAVLRTWLPLSEAVLGMAVDKLPAPAVAAPKRIPRLLGSTPGTLPASVAAGLDPGVVAHIEKTEMSLACSNPDPEAPLVVYVSKMVAVPLNSIPRRPGDPIPANQQAEVFLAFGRVFSGRIHEGQQVHVLSAGYSPSAPDSNHRSEATITGVFMMMGRALERVHSVPAGCVLALAGLESVILKSATLTSSPAARPLAPMTFQAAPIVRVAVEPALPAQMPQLVEGLRLLNRADPFVDVSVLDSGEHVLGAAGEVHLETCIKDLKERFARIELQVSPPLVAFRETVCSPEEAAAAAAATGQPYVPKPARVVEAVTPNTSLTVRVRALPLPGPAASCIEDHPDLVKRLVTAQEQRKPSPNGPEQSQQQAHAVDDGSDPQVQAFRAQLSAAIKASGSKHMNVLENAWQLGPRGMGPNILLRPPCVPITAVINSQDVTTGLFSVPASQVLRVGKQQGHQSGQQHHVSAAGASGASSQQQDVAAGGQGDVNNTAAAPARKLIPLPQVGEPHAANALGLHSMNATTLQSAAHANSHSHEQQLSPRSPSPAPTSSQPPQPQNVSDIEQQLAHIRANVESGLNSGFQLATLTGPLCEEPMWGVVFEVDVRLALPEGCSADSPDEISRALQDVDLQEDVYGPFSGQVMTTVAAACRKAMMEAEPRLVEALYLCAVQTSAEALSGVYAVLGKRRSRILREEMREGSDTFLVHAYLPVEASFGLADDMRRKSSGAAAASLLLSHWERLQVDPFFVPTTEEEREEHGEEGVASNAANIARKLIDAVRRRKGLPVEEKVVKVATKQRTLKRNV